MSDESGAQPELPDRRLARWLNQYCLTKGGGTRFQPPSRRAQPREFYVRCIHAWNAWRKKKTTTLRYVQTDDIPRVV